MAISVILLIIFLKLAIPSASGAIDNELYQVLKIFKTCYTDLIFYKTAVDIPEPEYPILVSTPRKNASVTPSTFREDENLGRKTRSNAAPRFQSRAGNSPKPIRVRFSCVSLVIFGVNTDNPNPFDIIRNSIVNRHNWVYLTSYGSGTFYLASEAAVEYMNCMSIALQPKDTQLKMSNGRFLTNFILVI